MKAVCAAFFAAILAFAGCTQRPKPPPHVQASPHYLLGNPYRAAGRWYYPAENYALDVTGLAAVAPVPDQPRLTADGEIEDPTALTAAMQTIQLPAIVWVTNLENGLQIEVRVNDRGPSDPGRVIVLSPRAATLLQVPPGGTTRVRVQVDTLLSHRLTEQIGGGPTLAISAAPVSGVLAQSLPPPGATGGGGQAIAIGTVLTAARAQAVPARLPERLRQVGASPGQLFLRAGSFGRYEYANVLAAKLGGLGGTVLRYREGRQEEYAVRAGPFGTVAQADAALARALGAGVVDARITVE